jgi:hypothetical protein
MVSAMADKIALNFLVIRFLNTCLNSFTGLDAIGASGVATVYSERARLRFSSTRDNTSKAYSISASGKAKEYLIGELLFEEADDAVGIMLFRMAYAARVTRPFNQPQVTLASERVVNVL